MDDRSSHQASPSSIEASEPSGLISIAEDLIKRSGKLCEELERMRIVVETEAEKVNNHWHAYIPGFSNFWQSNTNQHNRAKSLLERCNIPTESGSEAEGALSRDFRLLEGELSSYENHWSAIKKCHSVTWLRFAVPYQKSDGQTSVFVSAIVDNGHEWLRVLSTAERALLVQMAEADFPWDEPDVTDDDPELAEVINDEESQIEILKCAKQLLAAANAIHGGYRHRIRLVLPNVYRGRVAAIDRFLDGVQSLGNEEISLTLECAEETQSPPPPIETAISNLLSLGDTAPEIPLTPVLNIDTSIFVAMTTDISHNHGSGRKWRPKILEDVADEAEHGPRLSKSLYPIIHGHTLVCTREAAETCLRMVYDASTESEVSRLEILLGQETLRGRQDNKTAFLERVLRQDGWPIEENGQEATERRRRKLISELQKLSCHPVPEDLQLPIRIVEDFRRVHVQEESHNIHDSLDVSAFDKVYSQSAQVKFGNSPVAEGLDAIKQAFIPAFDQLTYMRHVTRQADKADNRIWLIADITYRVKGDPENQDTTIQASGLVTLVTDGEDAGKIARFDVFLDNSPIRERIEAVAKLQKQG
ncbi:hypothetical protein EsH8_II_000328 [Colletotrichum jinshuiense]